MYLKTEKPNLSASANDDIRLLAAYAENLKDEIEFRINVLNQKYEKLHEAIIKLQGGE